MKNIGNAIKTLRLKKNLSQVELAKKASITQGFLSLIEKNDREPNFVLIEQIANALGIPQQLLLLLACEETPRQKQYSKPLRSIALALNDLIKAVPSNA